MNLREDLVAALTAGLPAGEWLIVGYPDTPTRVEKRTVAVWSSRIAPQEGLGSAYRLDQTIEVLTPRQDVRQADDDLDDALMAVLAVLWPLTWLSVESAERTTNDEKTYHAWTITVRRVFTAAPEE
ncbi:hypothetical protein ACTHAM_002411 [Cellulomonas soli]|uniref:hypothetical protein n=1 Tax=Cellulomonas soli TaxID=931535 RepID=UPI003F86940B